jgi:hypothetical protein
MVDNSVMKRVFAEYLKETLSDIVNRFKKAKEECLGAEGLQKVHFQQIEMYQRAVGSPTSPTGAPQRSTQLVPSQEDALKEPF